MIVYDNFYPASHGWLRHMHGTTALLRSLKLTEGRPTVDIRALLQIAYTAVSLLFFLHKLYFLLSDMITLSLAYTEPANGPNLSIRTLTQEQVWNGLELKVRRPQEFIPSIDDCRVIEERGHGAYVLREALVARDLQQSPMAGQYVREECTLHRPIWVSKNSRTFRASPPICQLTRLQQPLCPSRLSPRCQTAQKYKVLFLLGSTKNSISLQN